ncbi:MAG: hypothetical protein ACOYME_05135 [Prochlorotrichaceae cyanobacterium]
MGVPRPTLPLIFKQDAAFFVESRLCRASAKNFFILFRADWNYGFPRKAEKVTEECIAALLCLKLIAELRELILQRSLLRI